MVEGRNIIGVGHEGVVTFHEESDELVMVLMGREDWKNVIEALEYLGGFTATPLAAEPETHRFIADSIQEVLDSSEGERLAALGAFLNQMGW